MSDPEAARLNRRLGEMQRQIDDLSVTVFACVCGMVVLLMLVIALAGQVVWR